MTDAITIVLVRPHNSGNLGAVARVMKNFALTRLALVEPQLTIDQECRNWACGADDLLDSAEIHQSLPAAIAGARLVVGTTGRRRTLTPEAIALTELAATAARRGGPLAVVFGPERTGLTSEELACCQLVVNIPTNPEFASLNLAQAVALAVWELRRQADAPVAVAAEPERAEAGQREEMFKQAEEALLAIDFLKTDKTLGPMMSLRRILDRREPTPEDVRFLRGIFRQILNLAKRKS
ncbi:RNA methyltransferase [Candidatus Sumerlaeota bacterium]